MFNFTEFNKKTLPTKLKVIEDLNKTLGIKNQESIDFILLTDANDLDKELIKVSNIYLIINKSDNRSNGIYSLMNDLQRSGYSIKMKSQTDQGQVQSLKEEYKRTKESLKDSEDTNSAEHTKLKSFFDVVLKEAFIDKVSDIHIEKRKTTALIKMRINGELVVTHDNQPTSMIENLCRVIHDIFAEKEGKGVQFSASEFQQAAINTTIGDEEVKLRYQSLPTYPDGFDVVLRLLPLGKDDQKIIPLTTLGFEANQEKYLKEIVSKPIGALVIAGTTGSGKSTTLKNLLMSVNLAREYKCKIYTIEDPPEYKIPHVSQIPVTRKKGETGNPFEPPLIATMRGDPDILMIGEIRDSLTGDGLKKATQSGHQVMTTVHAASGLGIIERLTDFNISPNVMSSPEFITGLLYQKLLPVVCPHCAKDFKELVESASSSEEVLELQQRIDDVFSEVSNKDSIVLKVRNNEGCEHCKHTGVSGRTICAELISPDFELLNYFKMQDPTGALKYWLETSDENVLSSNMKGKTIQEHAIYKMAKGLISPFDLEVAFGPINITKLKRLQLSEQKSNIDMKNMMSYFSVNEEVLNKVRRDSIKNGPKEVENKNSGESDLTENLKNLIDWD